jgi:hypothetical protein
VIEAPKLEPWIVRYELSDYEWAAIKPFLPNKSRGVHSHNLLPFLPISAAASELHCGGRHR